MEGRKILVRNAVKCLVCNEVLESKHRHDFVSCKCSNECFTDGGLVYQRIGAKELDLVESLAEYEELTEGEYQDRLDRVKKHREVVLQQRINNGEMVNFCGNWISKETYELIVGNCQKLADK